MTTRRATDEVVGPYRTSSCRGRFERTLLVVDVLEVDRRDDRNAGVSSPDVFVAFSGRLLAGCRRPAVDEADCGWRARRAGTSIPGKRRRPGWESFRGSARTFATSGARWGLRSGDQHGPSPRSGAATLVETDGTMPTSLTRSRGKEVFSRRALRRLRGFDVTEHALGLGAAAAKVLSSTCMLRSFSPNAGDLLVDARLSEGRSRGARR